MYTHPYLFWLPLNATTTTTILLHLSVNSLAAHRRIYIYIHIMYHVLILLLPAHDAINESSVAPTSKLGLRAVPGSLQNRKMVLNSIII